MQNLSKYNKSTQNTFKTDYKPREDPTAIGVRITLTRVSFAVRSYSRCVSAGTVERSVEGRRAER